MIVPNEILRAGRAAAGMTQSELSELSGVGKRTILRIERNERVAVRTLQKVQAALETKGVEFTPSADGKDPACAFACLCSRVTICGFRPTANCPLSA